jgi:hypothetical protein
LDRDDPGVRLERAWCIYGEGDGHAAHDTG